MLREAFSDASKGLTVAGEILYFVVTHLFSWIARSKVASTWSNSLASIDLFARINFSRSLCHVLEYYDRQSSELRKTGSELIQ